MHLLILFSSSRAGTSTETDGKLTGLYLMPGAMKENNIAQDDYQNYCLKIDKTHDHPMSEIISHSLSTLGCKAPGQPGAQGWPLP